MSEPRGVSSSLIMGTVPWKTFRRTLVTITTTATPIPTTPLTDRIGLWIFNVGTTDCFLGPSDVGSSNEPTLYAAQDRLIPMTDQVTLYGRTASGTATLIVWEFA